MKFRLWPKDFLERDEEFRHIVGGAERDATDRPLEMVAADRKAAARFAEILSARGLRWQSRTGEIEAIES
jgi:hypothetical protein